MNSVARFAAVVGMLLACVSGVQAEVVIDTVTVGNPGNAGELSGAGAGGYGPDRICGAVDYVYNIGKYEVTNAQYAEFLNAVAGVGDPNGLYSTDMWSDAQGCKIEQTGASPNYSYSVAANWAGRPVNYVSWYDALRFANWMHNGQPTGAQDASTTEDGAYDMSLGSSVVRKDGALVFLTSEDEWYKAAYHLNDGVTSNYFNYPTSSDSVPSNDLVEPDQGNNANFYQSGGFTIGAPYWRTEVGEFENSQSPYGTFDQGGNVWEWNEAVIYDSNRGVRGGSFLNPDGAELHAAYRSNGNPSFESSYMGFRVADLYEPIPAVSTWGMVVMSLLVLTAATVVLARRRAVTAI